ncbi:MAG: hypothetical protein ACRDRZ_03350, partial [Pseudonocardiaceae bacterium]
MRTASDTQARGAYLGLGAIVLVAVAGIMPGFTVGALAVPMQRDLGIGSTRFGLALACFFAVSAVASVLTRRIVPKLPVPVVLAGSVASPRWRCWQPPA